jgi:hypothetical protein
VDLLAHLGWLQVEINKKQGAPNPHPKPVRRPGQREHARPEPAPAATTDDLRRFFGASVHYVPEGA